MARCDLHDDWNPMKPNRVVLTNQGYSFHQTARDGRVMYETWRNENVSPAVYALVQYQWCNDGGWVPVFTITDLTNETYVHV